MRNMNLDVLSRRGDNNIRVAGRGTAIAAKSPRDPGHVFSRYYGKIGLSKEGAQAR